MTEIKLSCRGAAATAKVEGVITAGAVGIPVTISIEGEEWAGAAPRFIAVCGNVAKENVINAWHTTVPHECLLAGQRLFLGLDGWNEDGTIRIPTIWADCGMVKVSTAGVNPTNHNQPTRELSDQIYNLAYQANENVADLKRRADSGEFKGDKGDKGEDGEVPDADKIIEVSETQPTAEVNQAWVDPNAESFDVPSWEAFDALKQAHGALQTELNTMEDRVTALEDEPKVPESLVEQVDDNTRSLDALWKLSKGQVWDIEEKEESGLNDAPAGAKYMEALEVYGNTEQETTNGYQLVDTSSVIGKTFEEITTSSLIIQIHPGHFALSDGLTVYPIIEFTDGTNLGSNFVVSFSLRDSSHAQPPISNSGEIVNAANIARIYFYTNSTGLAAAKGKVIKNLGLYTIPNAPYEPYTGGIPSPNPDYPQEMQSVEEISIKHTDADGETIAERTIAPPRPLNKVNNVVDVCDIEHGVYRYMLAKARLDNITGVGIGSWLYSSSTRRFYRRDTRFIKVDGYSSTIPNAVCTHFKTDSYYNTINKMADMRLSYINQNTEGFAVTYHDYDDNLAGFKAFLDNNEIYVIGESAEIVTEPIAPSDLDFLRSLTLLPTDHHITVTDQNGNDVSYLLEYYIKLSEVH